MSKLPSTAIFAFDETGVVYIYGSPCEAVTAWEGIDVVSDVVRLYDANGVSLVPMFITQNQSDTKLGLFRGVQSGVYELVPNDEPADSLALALWEARTLKTNEWVYSIEQLKSDLRCNGIEVDFRPAR